ncbi:MAG: hypothetical protein VX367_09610, partial [SAR324 cluster bacterium]|nr:hypothetical protein [SAR324 cluster bacterium]
MLFLIHFDFIKSRRPHRSARARPLLDVLGEKTRPDTLQSSLGRLGRSSNEETAHNFRNICEGRTDRHGKV